MCMCTTYMQERESVSCVGFGSASNKRRTWFLLFFFFPFLNWAMSSTVLLVIINLVGRYRGERRGAREEWSHESYLATRPNVECSMFVQK